MKFVFEDLRKIKNFVNAEYINNVNENRFCPAPIVNAVRNRLHFEGYVERNKLKEKFRLQKFTENSINYIYPVGVHNGPTSWAGIGNNEVNIFDIIPAKVVEDMRKEQAFFLIDQSLEGYQTPWLWDFFHNNCERFNIPCSRLIYVTGNLIVSKVYNEWAQSNKKADRIKVIGYPHFEHDTYGTYLDLEREGTPLPDLKTQLNFKKDNLSKIKSYACLNKRIRSHRVWFYSKLFQNKLLDKGLVSMNPYDTEHGFLMEGKSIDEKLRKEANSILPLLVHNKPNNKLPDSYYISRFNPDICLHSWVSIVSEAHFIDSDDTLFISEKTFKPILCSQPFLILGNKGSIAAMKEMGFDTFDKYIDQSYDNFNTHERFDRLIKSIKKINNIKNKYEWYLSMSDSIEHNKEVIKKRSGIELPTAFSELYRYYMENLKTQIL